MKTTQILLHAVPAELLSLISKWLAPEDFTAAILRISPQFSVKQVQSIHNFEADVSKNGFPFRICIAYSAFEVKVPNLYEFMKINADMIKCIVDIGALGDEGLKESSVSITTVNSTEWETWSNIAKDIKKWTRAGLCVVSRKTGARKFSPKNRYTPGAAKLVDEGVKLLPIAGWNFFEIAKD